MKGFFSAMLALCLSLGTPAHHALAAPGPSPAALTAKVETGDIETVRTWLEGGMDPDYVGNSVGTGLMIAAWNGNIPMMALFVSHGADVNKVNGFGEQALMFAAWNGHTAAVRWLLSHGAGAKREAGQWSALHYAVFAGRGETMRLLIESGADINARSPNGSTVLMMAAREGHLDLARALVEAGADRKAVNEHGDGALEWAMRHNHLRVAQAISSAPEFARAVSRPREHWGEPIRSALAPAELERLVKVRALMVEQGELTDKIDRQIAGLMFARDLLAERELPPRVTAIEITASAKRAGSERVRLVRAPRQGQ